jgi:hypothetical protein
MEEKKKEFEPSSGIYSKAWMLRMNDSGHITRTITVHSGKKTVQAS